MSRIKSGLSEGACEVCDTLFDSARERMGHALCERCAQSIDRVDIFLNKRENKKLANINKQC